MSFDKQIQDKFSGFEPEVPDEQVDAGWEEIRYFLPSEEKKKRGFFFYRLNGMGISIVALLALTISSSIMLLLMKHGKKNSTLTALQRTSPTLRPANSEQAATHHTASASHPETNSGLEAAPIEASAVGTKQKSYMSVTQRSVKSLSVTYQNKNRSAFSGVLGNTRHAKQAKPGMNDSIQNLTATSIHHPQVPTQPDSIQNLLHRSGNTLAFMMPIKPAVLDGEAPFSPELNPEPALLSVDRIDPLPSNKRKPALELFAGLSNRSLLLQAEQDKKALQSAGFSTGIAGIFPVRSRFYLSGQFIVSHNPIKQRVEASAKEIIKKEVVRNTISSIHNYEDTLIYYVPYQSTVELKSGTAYHFSGGVGYQLLSKGRFSMDAALLLNFRWMRYNYNVSRQNSDTAIFINNIFVSNTASFYESLETSAAPAPVSAKKKVMCFGLNPSLSLVYQLSKKTGLILRPAYLLQLSPNALDANGKSYRLHENNWFINLGLRYRL